MKQTRKAQAALEYLMTYGWAFIGLLAVIGALIFMGASDSSSAVPSSCNFGTEFTCDSYVASENGTFAFVLTNIHRTAINVTQVDCTVGEVYTWSENLQETTFKSGATNVTVLCDSSNYPGTISISGKDKLEASVYYHYDETEALPRVETGTIVTAILDPSSTIFSQYIARSITII